MMVYQIPINTLDAGLYQWTMKTQSLSRSGHVVVRGTNAGPIGGFGYPAGTETWYWETTTGSGGTPKFTLELAIVGSPSDSALITAVTNVQSNETLAGTTAMAPTWAQGAPLPPSGDIVTLTDVSNGQGSYGQLYKHVSFFMPVGGNPVLPTWYTDIQGLYSVFGGSAQGGVPVQQGITAKMSWAKSGNAGYPKPSKWYWFGTDPS